MSSFFVPKHIKPKQKGKFVIYVLKKPFQFENADGYPVAKVGTPVRLTSANTKTGECAVLLRYVDTGLDKEFHPKYGGVMPLYDFGMRRLKRKLVTERTYNKIKKSFELDRNILREGFELEKLLCNQKGW